MPKYRVRGKIATVSIVDFCDIEADTPEKAVQIAWEGFDILNETADHDEPVHKEDWGADLLGEDGMTEFERGYNLRLPSGVVGRHFSSGLDNALNVADVKIIVPEGEFVLKNKEKHRHLLQTNGSERELTPDQAERLCAAGYIHICNEHSTPSQQVYHTHATQTWEEIEQVITELQSPSDSDAVWPELLQVAKCALADLEGIMPEYEPGGERTHPGWKTLEELRSAIAKAESVGQPQLIVSPFQVETGKRIFAYRKKLSMELLEHFAGIGSPDERGGSNSTYYHDTIAGQIEALEEDGYGDIDIADDLRQILKLSETNENADFVIYD